MPPGLFECDPPSREVESCPSIAGTPDRVKCHERRRGGKGAVTGDMSFVDYLRFHATANQKFVTEHVHVYMANRDLVAGTLLSRLVYWHSPNLETGQPRLTIVRDGERWLRKAYEEWWFEICLTAGQARRAVGILRERHLVETRVWKHRGAPTLHLRILGDEFMVAFRIASAQLEAEMRQRTDGNALPSRTVATNGSDLSSGTDGNAPADESMDLFHSADPLKNNDYPVSTSSDDTPESPDGDSAKRQPTVELVDKPDTPQTILADYIDWKRRQLNDPAYRPERSTFGQLSREVKSLTEQGDITTDEIKRGLADWDASGMHPRTLPTFVDAIRRTRNGNGRRSGSGTADVVSLVTRKLAEARGGAPQ
jgi:hypothetical protein